MPESQTNEQTKQDNTEGGGGAAQAGDTWLNALPEDVRTHDDIKGFSDAGALAKEYVSLKGRQPLIPEADKYEVKFPEGFTPDDEQWKSTRELANRIGLTNGQLQKIVDAEIQMLQRMADKRKESYEKWKSDTKKDNEEALKKEYGDKYDANMESAKKVIRAIDSQGDFKKFLDDSGMGNHPALIKFFVRMAGKLSEDVFEPTKTPPKERERAESGQPMLDYPSMEKK